MQLREEMRPQRLQPDAITYAAVNSTCYLFGVAKCALQLLEAMQLYGFQLMRH